MIRKGFPALELVDKAVPKQLKYWKQYLPGPQTEDERKIIERIRDRLKKKG